MVDGADDVRGAHTPADRIVFLGHATVLVELEGVRLLFDPLLRDRVLHLRRQTPMVDRSVFAEPHAVLISHMHHDHLDLPSLRMLGEQTPLIVPAGAGAWLRRRGFSTVTELGCGDVATVGTNMATGDAPSSGLGSHTVTADSRAAAAGSHTVTADVPSSGGVLTVAAVEAHHNGHRTGGPHAKALGYLVAGRRVVYFAGDTELFAGMGSLSPSPDLALLPVAGWGPKLGPGHMDPLQAARAVELLKPRLAIPIHWGTLLPVGFARNYHAGLGDPPRLFAEHVARLAPGVEVRILTPGQSTAID